MKRGAHGVLISNVVVVVVRAVCIQIVRVVGVVVVAGTQPARACLIRVISPKVNGFYTALSILLYIFNPSSVCYAATFPLKRGKARLLHFQASPKNGEAPRSGDEVDCYFLFVLLIQPFNSLSVSPSCFAIIAVWRIVMACFLRAVSV